MMLDQLESGGDSWTKLLDEKDSAGHGAMIVRMANSDGSLMADLTPGDEKESTPLTMDLLPPHCGKDKGDGSVISDVVGGGAPVGIVGVGTDGIQLARKESILGSFHRHLRRSLKAVSESPGPITRYRQTRFSSRRVRKRVIFKHGDCNVVQGNVAKRRRRYLQDIFTTLVDAQWRWTMLVFALSFLISWAFFGLIWWTIAYAHGDLEYIQMRDYTPKLIENMTHTMCVTEVRSLTSAFLYSIETQHTIGYGNRFVTEECPEAIFTMCLQCIMGVFIQAFMVGIVFAKLSRPKKRAQTLLFSRNAVICHRDGLPCLMFRVGDMRKSHIIEAHVRAQIIRKKVTKEGEILPFYQQELSVGNDGGEDRLMFIWPTTVVHKIDRNSPLYMLSASDMLKERFEVVVMLEGVIESTGMTTQARSSYLPTEILWGHRFVNVVSFRKETGEYEVDYTLFNNTYDVDTPLCSSKQLDELKAEYSKNSKSGLERAISAGLLQRITSIPSVDRLDPASDESLDSTARLPIRSDSIPNGILPDELQPLTGSSAKSQYRTPTFTVGGSIINASPSTLAVPPTIYHSNLQSINESTKNSGSSSSTSSNSNNNYNINNNNNNNSNNNGNSSGNGGNASIKQKAANARRLSIKQDQLPIDSIC